MGETDWLRQGLTAGILAISSPIIRLKSEFLSVVIAAVAVWPAAAADVWPVEDTGIVPFDATVSVGMDVPDYLSETAEARWTGADTVLKRISDTGAFDPPNAGAWNNFGPIYAGRQHWNADGSKLIVYALATSPDGSYARSVWGVNPHLLHGTTHAYLGKMEYGGRSLPAQWRWSNTDPDEIVFVDHGPNTLIEKLDVSTGTYSVLKDFGPEGYEEISNDFSGGVGDPDLSGRYWALSGRKGSQWRVFCWDHQTDAILCEIPLPYEPGGSSGIVSLEMSRTGAFIVINSTDDWTSGPTPVGRGVSVWSKEGVFQRSINVNGPPPDGHVVSVTGHHPLGVDTDGEDRYVAFFTPDGNDRWMASYRLSDGTRRDESVPGLMLGGYYLVSCAFAKPEWVVVSDGPIPDGNGGSWRRHPMRGHLWAFKLDGSKRIYPIAESRFSLVDFTSADTYFWMPWATPNRDLSQILFRSAMDTDWSPGGGGNPTLMHAYIAKPK
ncbi:MAG TPA: hypothetical protein PLA50_02845 [Bacteroidia bacterium]|nr:hypothetical protein [Bacteroidia bacterium]